jgi:hypothetical protein
MDIPVRPGRFDSGKLDGLTGVSANVLFAAFGCLRETLDQGR